VYRAALDGYDITPTYRQTAPSPLQDGVFADNLDLPDNNMYITPCCHSCHALSVTYG